MTKWPFLLSTVTFFIGALIVFKFSGKILNPCTVRILVDGDSNGVTAGGFPPELYGHSKGKTWAQHLNRQLNSHFSDVRFKIYNRSVAGEDVLGLLNGRPYTKAHLRSYIDSSTGLKYSRLPIDKILENDRPDIVFLMVGTNDAPLNDTVVTPENRIRDFENHYRALISKIESFRKGKNFNKGRPFIVLITPPPAAIPEDIKCCNKAPMSARDYNMLVKISKFIVALGSEKGLPVINFYSIVKSQDNWLYFGDAHPKILPSNIGLIVDGVHLSEAGRKLLADEAIKVAKDLVPEMCPTK